MKHFKRGASYKSLGMFGVVNISNKAFLAHTKKCQPLSNLLQNLFSSDNAHET
jgi:hypothetical protein